MDPTLADIDEAAAAAAEGGVEKGDGEGNKGGGGGGGGKDSRFPNSKGLVDFQAFNSASFKKVSKMEVEKYVL